MLLVADASSPDTYDLPMTSPPSDPPASPVDAAKTWRHRARFRWRIAALLGVLAVILLFLFLVLNTRPIAYQCPFPGCPAPQADPWVAVSALGTLAAGIGAVISAIAAILALRAAAAAKNITPAPATEQRSAVAPKKPPAKRRRKR
jgi:hypothetical protein